MEDKSPVRGAAVVNNELEVGYDAAFESRWRHIELTSHVFMGVIVIAALGGVFGRGPLSHRTHQTPDGRLAVDFEPIARYGTSTQITMHLSPDTLGTARVVLNSTLIEPMGLQQIIPSPKSSEAVADGIAFVFDVAPRGDTAVRFVIKPNDIGPIRLAVSQGAIHLAWTQFILP
jgi:hypothetical protein